MNTSEKMDKTWAYCLELYGPRCVVLTLHGSQNYCLDLPESDVDAKLMVVPTWNDIIHYTMPISETIPGPYGDINVTDICLFIENNLRKQNFNFIECLFTPYYRVNPKYADLWDELIVYREDIAHYKPEVAVRTMMGQMENQRKRWGKFDDNKTLYHMLRIKWAIIKYVAGANFEETMVPLGDTHDLIMEVRLGKIAQSDMEFFANSAYKIVTNVAKHAHLVQAHEQSADCIMEHIQTKIIERALKGE